MSTKSCCCQNINLEWRPQTLLTRIRRDMEKYLQKLVIILPATAIAMGGLLLMVCVYAQSRSKGSTSNLRVPQRCVTTQVDDSLQMNKEIRIKLIKEAMERVKSILSEEFRKKQATKISQEEFNNHYRKQRGLGSGDMDAKKMEPVFRIPGVASLDCAPKTQDSALLKKTDSFATLWVEELQKSGDGDSVPNTQTESELPDMKEPTLEALPITPPQHSVVISSDSSGTGIEPESLDCIMTQLGLSEATDLNEVKSPNELRLIHDLESFLLTVSSNLCQSMMAFSMAQNSSEEMTLNSNAELSMMPGYDYLEHSAEALASVASTSTSLRMNVPQLLKGGASPVNDFEWRLDIDEEDVEESPPNTPVRRRPPSHSCRGVRFMYEDHPPALSLIDLDPDLGYGWRGPEWKEKYGKYHIYNERKGPSIYRKPKLHIASDPGVSAYYKSVRVEANRKWDTIKNRYREAREKAFLRAELQDDIHESAEWRKHLTTLYSDSSSPSESDQPVRIKRVAGQQGENELDETNQADDTNRIKSMLTSSSSSFNSDESSEKSRQLTSNPQCKMEHQHCSVLPVADHESSKSSTGIE